MDAFIQFFENLGKPAMLAWIFICLGINWMLEVLMPLFDKEYRKWNHARTNLILLGTTLIINSLFGLATVGVFIWTKEQNFGLINWLHLPTWAELLVAIMFLDLVAQYLIHYMLHKVSWMWKFHMIHHSDTMVDATTGTRHHPGDYVTREVFGLIAVFLGGIPLAYFLVYKISTIFFTYLTHANIVFPQKLDKILSYVFVTPNMHKFHHHFERPWTDTNFGNIFSFWDRIFGTMVHDDPRKVVYGLDVLPDEKSRDLGYQLKVPFDKSIKTDY